ncbi:hypothetical protein DUNSADRAFT_15685 [Dunaliella salina]|uniref:SHSP domain-containing protein n=1 Tax=Dunaliella salina TaxID=3046 RepID=A0ABQ7G4Y5_DUNSA|nr:hypothetical protein DUNSADRAFT_15685 [Dunaliella salina]|eukprot:KAF5829660.1 hypothetical protein DUNSADRAFT_15685 [Dunaliella salina]
MQLQGVFPSTPRFGRQQLRTQRKLAQARSSVLARASSANPYQVPGRFGQKELPPITDLRVGGNDELPIFARIQPTLPATPGLRDIPLVVMSSGFLLPSSAYTSYANHLASHGFAVIRYDVSEVMDDVGATSALGTVIDAALRENSIGSIVDPKFIVLFGHSRGAKLSCMLAEREDRVRGMVLLDPVDNTAMTPAGEGFPSSLPSLKQATEMRSLPVLVVGAAMNGDLIPAEGNYKKFNDACMGPFWEVDLLGAGHLSFLDKRDEADMFTLMAAMMGQPPSTPEASVSAVSKVAATAWLREVVLPYAARSTSASQPPPPKDLERMLYDSIVNINLPDGEAPRRSDIRGLERQTAQGSSNVGGATESVGRNVSQGEGTRQVQNIGLQQEGTREMRASPAMRLGRMSNTMKEMRREMDSMMSSFGMRQPLSFPFPSALSEPWAPDEDLTPNVIRRTIPVSMEEKDKSYVFTAEVPGLTPQDVKVTVDTETRMLTISGQRQEEMTPEEQKGGAIQRSSVSFVRSFRLPGDVDLQSEKSAASASVKNGILKLEMPKTVDAQSTTTKEIPVM